MKRKKVFLLCGCPGSGKSTWVKKFTDGKYNAISRDDIRFELGFCDKDQKVVLDREKEDLVTKEFNKQIKERFESNNNIIIDNINLKKKYREEIKNYIKSLGYDPYYEYIYIEAPSLNDNIKRRENFRKRSCCRALIIILPDHAAGRDGGDRECSVCAAPDKQTKNRRVCAMNAIKRRDTIC